MWTTDTPLSRALVNRWFAFCENICTQWASLIVSDSTVARLNRLQRRCLYPSLRHLGLTAGIAALCAIALVGPIAAETGPSATIAAELYTRRYPLDGFELDAGFTPDKTECILGEPLFITFSVKNVSGDTYQFFVGGDIRGSVRHNNFRITAVDANGQPVRDPYSYNHFGGPGNDVELESGKSYTERLYLGFWCAFEEPGMYQVTCERILNMDRDSAKYPRARIITAFKLNILPFDRGKMQEVIAGLGKKLREGDNQQTVYESTLALSEIDDKAVIPHLTVSLTKGDYQNRRPAVKGLSRFSTNAAADALLIALKDPDYAVGEAAGEALRKNKMADRAVDTLLKQLRDVPSSVRALAARSLGYTRSERALDPLIKAMDDPTPAVGQAAAEALGKLGHKGAIPPLRKRAEGPVMDLRVAAAKGLRELGDPLPVDSLAEVIKSTTDINDQNFHESIRLIRLYGGERAAPALIRCLMLDDPSPRNQYNLFLILGIEYSPNGPKCYSNFFHDPNTDGTPEQVKNNRQVFDALKDWLEEVELKR